MAAVFAPADFFDVRALPGGFLLHFFDDIFFVDEDETVEAELLFARGSQVVFMALVDDFVSELAHVTDTDSDKGDGRRFVEGKLSDFFGDLLLKLRLLLLGWLIY